MVEKEVDEDSEVSEVWPEVVDVGVDDVDEVVSLEDDVSEDEGGGMDDSDVEVVEVVGNEEGEDGWEEDICVVDGGGETVEDRESEEESDGEDLDDRM